MHCASCGRTNSLFQCDCCRERICFACSRQSRPPSIEEQVDDIMPPRVCNPKLRQCGFNHWKAWLNAQAAQMGAFDLVLETGAVA